MIIASGGAALGRGTFEPRLAAPISVEFAGLPGSGKSTIAARVAANLRLRSIGVEMASVERVPDDMKTFVCARTRHALIVQAGHPLARARKISLADIAEFPLVLPRSGLQHRRMIDDAFRAAGVEYRAALETEGWEVMKHYVALGFGIAIVNDLCLAHSVPPEIVSRPLGDLFPERVYRAIWAKKRRLPSPATQFLTDLRAVRGRA